MAYEKKIVCLANSRKPPSGRCVAGREVIAGRFGPWIRPVSKRTTRELSEQERQYADGRDVSILDVVKVPLLRHEPERHQPENHVIDADYPWEQIGRVKWHEIQNAVEDPAGPLWLNGYSSLNGLNDRVPENKTARLTRSLYLIRPKHLSLIIVTERSDFGSRRRRVRAEFQLCGYSYRLAVTDPWIEEQMFSGRRIASLDESLVCVSLGDIYYGYAYKLVATVITPERQVTEL